MSTILKALRRLEEDRSLEQAHSLQEHVTGGSGEPPKTSSQLQIAAIVAVGLGSAALGSLGFALWSNGTLSGPPPVASAPIASSTPATVTATPPATVTAPVRPASPPATQPRTEIVEELLNWTASAEPEASRERGSARQVSSFDRPSLEERLDDGSQEGMGEPEPLQQLAKSNPVPERPVQFADDIALVVPEEDPIPRIQGSKPAAIEQLSPLAVLVEEPLPVIHRVKLPDVEVVKTIWHPQASRRQAVLRVDRADALLTAGEGDAVGALVLLEIQPAGVVFGHDGIQIQKRVGDRSGL